MEQAEIIDTFDTYQCVVQLSRLCIWEWILDDMLSREGLILGCYLSVGIFSLETWSIDKGAC